MSGLDLRSSHGLPREGCVLYSPRHPQEPPAQGSVPTSNRLCPYILLLSESLEGRKMRAQSCGTCFIRKLGRTPVPDVAVQSEVPTPL